MKGQANQFNKDKLEIQKLLSISGVMELSQLTRMIDVKPDTLLTILTQMQRSGRLIRSGNRIAVNESALDTASPLITQAMWVFADFIRRADYYTSGEFPAAICFFADGEEYEIIPVEVGRENIVNRAVTVMDEPTHRLVLIQNQAQVNKLRIPGFLAYCMVEETGKVQYFKENR